MLNSIKEFDSNEILLGIILMLIYSFINVFFPILILIKLGELKTQIKKIGLIKNNNNLDSLVLQVFKILLLNKRNIHL